MNKTAIKNFAIWARRKLISDITYKAGMMGVAENGVAQPLPQSTRDLQFFDIGTKDYAEVSGTAIEQRNALIKIIRAKEQGSDYKTAFRNVVEEVAYTWFNRLIAVRFMEVNDYLPSHVRVLSSENAGKLEPDFVTSPFDTDLDFSPYEKDLVYQLKDENKLDELFRLLFIKQCNKLSEILPGLFEQISDYTELLLNISFTDKDGIVYHLTHDISEDEFNVEKEGQVEIIGWMYQYYNTEPKDEVFALLKKNVKITKERIPAATQLFTPDWIVRYMVENSLGRLWVEGHPNESLRENWKYYLDEAEQEPGVVSQLKKIREDYAKLDPTDIKVIDPCMGSGHILVYAFDVLLQIYTSQGYVERDAAKSILINNLYGIDIDTRAYQLAYFAVMMKARQYNRKIFLENITPNLIAIRNPENVSTSVMKRLGGLEPLGLRLLEDFEDAEEYGSILQVDYTEDELERIEKKLAEIEQEAQYGNLLVQMEAAECCNLLLPLIKQARLLSQKYDVVVTNPPYMGANGVADKLANFVKNNYPDSKSDLFSVFMERCSTFTVEQGFYAMITQPSVLFLSSFAMLRKKIIEAKSIISLLHMGRGIFGIDFGSTSFVIKKEYIRHYKGQYFRLHERNFQYIDPDDIAKLFIEAKNDHGFRFNFGKYNTTQDSIDDSYDDKSESTEIALQLYFEANQDKFLALPGSPIAYWLSDRFIDVFNNSVPLGSIADSKQGIATADNNRFLREWYEVSSQCIFFNANSHDDAKYSQKKWYPYNKGGEFRKWYGNDDYVVNWYHDGEELRSYKKAVIRNPDYYFKECFSWSLISSGIAAFRYKSIGKLFDVAGMSCFSQKHLLYLLALCNSTIATSALRVIAPTINYQCGDIANIPVIIDESKRETIEFLASECVKESKKDWDSFELSWDFSNHPLIPHLFLKQSSPVDGTNSHLGWQQGLSIHLSECFDEWKKECQERYDQIKTNEEKINSLFIEIYGLQDEMIPEVKDKYITIRKADLGRDIRSLVSYAVGCMFGRYSLDLPGLTYAGGEWDASRYTSFVPDVDNCIPITDGEYFTDDIVGRFVEFVRVAYGAETIEENLDFVAAALGNKGNTSREVIRNYFLNDFYKDHLKVYQKRPIYWLFDSGKQNGFRALVYMHRWNADTVGNLRIEYLHKMQTIYEYEIETCQDMIDHGSGQDIAAATKRKEKLIKQLKECKDYDAKVAHIAFSKIDIDLDDGVKANYRKVQTGADGKFCEILADSKDIMAKEK